MKSTLIRAWDAKYDKLAAATRRSVWKWCSKHDTMLVEEKIRPGKIHPSWTKLEPVIDALLRSDEPVIWCDADIVITDIDFDLSEYYPTNGIVFAEDEWGLCAGFFIAQGKWAADFLGMLEFLGPAPPFMKHEQDAIKILESSFYQVSEHISTFRHVANPDTRFTEKAPFAYHAWAGDCQKKLNELAAAMEALEQSWTQENLNAAKDCRHE